MLLFLVGPALQSAADMLRVHRSVAGFIGTGTHPTPNRRRDSVIADTRPSTRGLLSAAEGEGN